MAVQPGEDQSGMLAALSLNVDERMAHGVTARHPMRLGAASDSPVSEHDPFCGPVW